MTARTPHRVALYVTPPPTDPLAKDAAVWLGRSPWSAERPGAPLGLSEAGPETAIASPRRYGFHATLKAPFRLADGQTLEALTTALEAFAAKARTVTISRLALGRLGPFFALVEDAPNPQLHALAGAVVTQFERFRAPLTADELERRRQAPLTPKEEGYLQRYGYPYVLDAFRFHMTLTGPTPDEERDIMDTRLRERFAAHIGQPFAIDAITIFIEPDPGAPFLAVSRHTLRA